MLHGNGWVSATCCMVLMSNLALFGVYCALSSVLLLSVLYAPKCGDLGEGISAQRVPQEQLSPRSEAGCLKHSPSFEYLRAVTARARREATHPYYVHVLTYSVKLASCLRVAQGHGSCMCSDQHPVWQAV